MDYYEIVELGFEIDYSKCFYPERYPAMRGTANSFRSKCLSAFKEPFELQKLREFDTELKFIKESSIAKSHYLFESQHGNTTFRYLLKKRSDKVVGYASLDHSTLSIFPNRNSKENFRFTIVKSFISSMMLYGKYVINIGVGNRELIMHKGGISSREEYQKLLIAAIQSKR